MRACMHGLRLLVAGPICLGCLHAQISFLQQHSTTAPTSPPACACCACRDSLWRVLFWQPLHAGAGFYLVNLLALAAALWASLHVHSLWQLLR